MVIVSFGIELAGAKERDFYLIHLGVVVDLKLRGKKVLVMGSSTGLGKAIAKSFVREGAEVALCARNVEKLERTAHELGCNYFFPCDLSKPGQAREVVEKTIKHLGGIDILVTNTGGPKKGAFADITEDQWLEDFQNLWLSVTESLKVALPEMKKQNFGRVLLVTSLAAREPMAGLTTSNGLRAGLPGLVKSIANEYAAFGITLNCLLPGYTDTERLKELNLSEERVKQLVPAGRLGDPHELADLAVFLASPLSGYTTGQSIAVDGGALRSH
jgi:3-oxoacyl-[acyl-carrier protein] reductase